MATTTDSSDDDYQDSTGPSSSNEGSSRMSLRSAYARVSRYLSNSHSSSNGGSEASNSDPGGSASAASPVKQRKAFSGKRWLGLRKQSQGKNEKGPSGAQSPANAEKPVPLKKIPSDKKLKLPYSTVGENNGRGDDHDVGKGVPGALDEAEDEAADVELPPPMKPIQNPQAVLQAPQPAAAASAPAAREQHGGASSSGRSGEEEEPPATPGPDSYEAICKKREYVLRELVDTEEIYVSDLRLVCEGYMRHMQDPNADPGLPEGLRDRHRMIFGNIEAIYEWHRDKFVRELHLCVEEPELLGPLFRRFLEKRMFLYETYCRNKPVSEYIVSEHDHYFQELRIKLGQKLQLGDLLIKPIQRIQKYHLLVKKILSYSEHANCPPHVVASLREAVECTDIIPKNANSMMDVGRLQGFAGNITAQGKLLMQESMMVTDVSSGSEKTKELQVFLFEQCIIFSEAVGKKSQYSSPAYNYKAHVQVNRMDVEELDVQGAFVVHSDDPSKQKRSYMCRPSEATRAEWLSTLNSILTLQKNFGAALENPGAYLREQLTREPARDPAATFSAIGRDSKESSASASKEASVSDAASKDEETEATMNRENVSNKIAAGMDRWQNTLEEMINLRGSNNQVFKDYYWAQNGFDELRRYVKQGSDFSKELSSILQERIEAEIYYSKCLAKLGTKLTKACKESVGSCAEAWKHVAMEMEKRSEIHRNYSSALSEELVKPMKHVIDNQLKLRKKIEGNVDKTTRSLSDWRTAEAKSKKHSHTAARENEKLQDATLEISRLSRSSSVGHIPHAHSILSAARAERLPNATSEKDAAKLQVKKRKTEDAVKKTEVEYYNVCVHAERARLEWETSVVKGAGMMESLEEERLAQLKTAADCYLRLTSAIPAQLAEATNILVTPIKNANANSDMRVVRGVRTAPTGASEQLLPDFYCEHTTLAMNKERRKQALLKILQLVKQDIDRERKSKQGLEKLSMAIKQTPTFGNDDSQQNVADKLYHMRSMLTYLEAVRYKITASLNELDSRPPVQHPLAAHIQIIRDKQGLQQSILKVPPWLQADYQNEVNKNLQPNYSALTKSVSGGEERERRDSIMSRASSKLRIEHLSFRRNTEHKSAPATPVVDLPTPTLQTQPLEAPHPPESPLDWSERGAGDGLSNQQDSDFDEFSSQSDSSTDLTDIIKSENGDIAAQTPSLGKCRALYTYEARLNDELNLSPGDIIDIHEKQDDGWWSGDLNGIYGIFPSSYVEEITTCI